LPNSYLFENAGLAYGDEKRDANIKNALAEVVQQIAPDKAQKIAVFCASSECWLSINTLLRMQSLGYTNLHWYRGGIAAWMNAGLPTVNTVPFATFAGF
jgi:rhodanese-related sulfurtransferase